MHDVINGEFNSAVGVLHLHPDIKVNFIDDNRCILHSVDYEIELEMIGADLSIVDSTWHPGFGVVMASKKLIQQFKQSRVTYKINWKKL